MRKVALLAAVFSIIAAATSPADQPGQPTTPTIEPPAHITRVGKRVITPRRHIKLVRKFTPTATPTPGFVLSTIIPYEAARWNVSASWLRGRISCETGSTFHYYAHNASGASGLGQFLPGTWARAMSYWSRAVSMTRRGSDHVRRRVVLTYSDGSRKIVRGRLVRRDVVIVRRGLLPRWPSAYHGWAAVRATARAMAGIGAVRASEWDCQ